MKMVGYSKNNIRLSSHNYLNIVTTDYCIDIQLTNYNLILKLTLVYDHVFKYVKPHEFRGCLHETCHVLWSYGRKSTQKIILFYAEQYDVRNINQSTIRFDCLNKGVEKPEDRKINMKVPVVFEELQLHDTNVKIMDPVVTEKTVKHKRRSIWSRIKTFFRRMLCNSIKLLKIKL